MISALRRPQVRALLAASLVSTAGDQLARVALTVLVFHRTGSTLLAGFSYAATFLPALVGAPLLAGLADRRSRRRVMVQADLVRAGLIGCLALPGIPVPVALGVVVVATLVECPFDAARAALLPTVSGSSYPQALALDRAVQQGAQVLGFAAGGVVLALLTPSVALLLDAVTFLASALLLTRYVEPQQVADPGPPAASLSHRVRSDVRHAWHVVVRDPAARHPVVVVWVACAAACVPEGLAAPYVHALGRGAGSVAVLMAANPLGNALAGLALARTPARLADRLLTPLSFLVSAPLALCLLDPSYAVLVALVGVSGAGMGLSVLARGLFVQRVPDALRGRAFALAATGITVAQGLAIGVSAALAEVLPPAVVVGGAGALGTAAALVLMRLRPRTQPTAEATAVSIPPARSAYGGRRGSVPTGGAGRGRI